MNIPKAFEAAVATVIQAHCNLTDLPRIRTWQAIDGDLQWTPSNDRSFPLVDIRATPPAVGEDGVTLQSTVAVLIGTNANDDPTHADMARYYEAVQTVLDALYAQFRACSAGAERVTFDATIADQHPAVAALVSIGGFEHGDPMAPYEDGGAYFIGLNWIIHFSRNDY
jgi:hypothetical protein